MLTSHFTKELYSETDYIKNLQKASYLSSSTNFSYSSILFADNLWFCCGWGCLLVTVFLFPKFQHVSKNTTVWETALWLHKSTVAQMLTLPWIASHFTKHIFFLPLPLFLLMINTSNFKNLQWLPALISVSFINKLAH